MPYGRVSAIEYGINVCICLTLDPFIALSRHADSEIAVALDLVNMLILATRQNTAAKRGPSPDLAAAATATPTPLPPGTINYSLMHIPTSRHDDGVVIPPGDLLASIAQKSKVSVQLE